MKKLTPTAFLSLASISIILACGPYYAPRLLGYKNTVIDTPSTGIDLMFPENKKKSNPHHHLENLPLRLRATYDADIADLKKAAPDLAKKAVDKYSAIRSDMIISMWDKRAVDLGAERPKTWLDEATLNAIPKEFSIYLQGAVAYRSGQTVQARDHWKALIALPAKDREYRTIWAAWMLARTSTADGEAMLWYAKVKQYKKDGFRDSLDVTGKDWTGFFALKSNDFTTALSVYIQRGKNLSTDSVSVARDINEVFYHAFDKHKKNPKEMFSIFAKNKEHAIALSYFLNRWYDYTPEYVEEHTRDSKELELWIKALRESNRKNIDKELGLCATVAYSIQNSKILNLCLETMQNPTTDSLWLQAKLATIKGNLNEASRTYHRVTKSIISEGQKPEDIEIYYYGSYREEGEIAQHRLFTLYSEHACVELGLKNYNKALDLFLIARNRSDASYIAETILSPVELLDYVRNSKIAQNSEWMKALLTRKLMRNEYFKDAKTFALDKHLKTYNSYIKSYRLAINKAAPAAIRAQAYINAAKVLREHGSELFYLQNSCRPFLRISAAGRKMHANYDYTEYYDNPLPAAKDFIPKITSDELQRIKRNYVRISPISTKDRHAAELLYRAAILLPKNDNQTAKLLWKAGDWTRADPQVADKYYQSLIKRCPLTHLGKACDKRRWFLHAHELKMH